jgi:hypothetical protein
LIVDMRSLPLGCGCLRLPRFIDWLSPLCSLMPRCPVRRWRWRWPFSTLPLGLVRKRNWEGAGSANAAIPESCGLGHLGPRERVHRCLATAVGPLSIRTGA